MLEADRISKSFPGVQALDGVSLRAAPGEVLCVVGENGAGKSTLMKILAGVDTPDSGELRIDGRPVRFATVADARRAGIALIHQELNLADSLDAAGNIFLGREPSSGGRLRLVSNQIYDDARRIMDRLGLDCSPRAKVGELSLGQRQLVEIGRALSLSSRYLIFDEPTSSLTERETARLFAVIESLKREGVGIVYISHRLKEIGEIADRVAVLRDGRNAGELAHAEVSHQALVERMVGRDLRQFFHRTRPSANDAAATVARVRNVRWSAAQREGISFDVRAGEIVGVGGLMGSGRTELAETLFGLRPRRSGDISIDGRLVSAASPPQSIEAGILLVPEERRRQGLFVDFSINDNIGLPSLDRLRRWGLVDRRAERSLAESMFGKLAIRAPSVGQSVGLLSGGNQQKVVLAKWLARSPRLLILDEPTRGVDVGAKAEIYSLLDRLAADGAAVLMISSDLEELLGVSDRVLVMHDHQLAGELPRDRLTEQAVMHLATGARA